MVDNMAGLNYSYAWTLFIGSLDLLGGIGLIFSKYRGYAACGLLFLLHGAVGSHITHNDPIGTTVGGAGFAMVLLVVLLVLDKPFNVTDKVRTSKYFAD
jgi:hypothetical protein